MNFKFNLTTTVTEKITLYARSYIEELWDNYRSTAKYASIDKLTFSLMDELGIPYDYIHNYTFKFVWNLNSTIKGVVESVDVYVDGTKVNASIVSNPDEHIKIDIDLYGVIVTAYAYYNPSRSWSELKSLEEVSIHGMYRDDVHYATYNQYVKPIAEEKIQIFIQQQEQEAIKKEQEEAEKKARIAKIEAEMVARRDNKRNAFLEYARSQNVLYWTEESIFINASSIKENYYVFSSTKEWIDERQTQEYNYGEWYSEERGWYKVKDAKTIEEFPHWEKALKYKDIKVLYDKLGLELPETFWFKDKGFVSVNSL